MPALARHALLGVAVVLLQWLVLKRLDIYGAYPDAVLLYVTWMSLRYGRLIGSEAGFVGGLLLDAMYSPWWGLHMFLKTLTGFAAGFFPASQRELLIIRPGQAFIGGLVVALFHNGLMVILLALDTGSRSLSLVTSLWLGSSFYTAVLAALAALFYNR